jgi:hypothetical protein
MYWIALAAAAQLSAPVPKNLRSWFSYEDVPSFLIEQGHGFWEVSIRVDVAPDGKIRGCTILSTSSDARLDGLTCEIVRRRARFEPAHYDGSAAFGAYRTSVSWAVAERPTNFPTASSADLDLVVEGLPAHIKSPSSVRVMFAVDAKGALSSCSAEPGEALERAVNDPALVPVACQQIAETYAAVPATDATGRPTLSVQDALVRFSTDKK